MDYALYKGDKLISIGTIHEIAKELGIKERSIYYLTTDAYKRKLAKSKNSKDHRVLIPIDDDEDEE